MLMEEANEIKQRKGYVAKVESCIASILQIGLSCSADLPRGRMDVGDVLMELHQIRHSHSREIELQERELEICSSVEDKSVGKWTQVMVASLQPLASRLKPHKLAPQVYAKE
ncbi:hypothetical protein RJ639_023759 [Escallonia herrerae]|uniref:Uncharacterized protein n=1 Tax=Escallonia herrerae TaxID=1293975 RepID=A0AA88UYH8_9ASTE|nr:hypothetical protein RJ639_023759 [Escallonia herrerae]